jgi:hypothetical protein
VPSIRPRSPHPTLPNRPPNPHSIHSDINSNKNKALTYDHRLQWGNMHPVRSATHKPQIGKVVLEWVTIREGLLLYVFSFLLLSWSNQSWSTVRGKRPSSSHFCIQSASGKAPFRCDARIGVWIEQEDGLRVMCIVFDRSKSRSFSLLMIMRTSDPPKPIYERYAFVNTNVHVE